MYEYKGYRVTSDVDCKAVMTDVDADKIKFDFEWDLKDRVGSVSVNFSVPCTGIECVWEPTCLMNRNYNLVNFASSAMGAVPLIAYCNGVGNSIFSVAVSDSIKQIEYHFEINETTAEMDCKITVGLKQFGEKNSYSFILYVQKEELPLYKMCKNVSDWWEEIYSLSNIYVPDYVTESFYSTWYSFHHDFNADKIINECREAKEYGMKGIILDAGWYNDDLTTGSRYTGDWNVSTAKIPDMKQLVNNVHDLGMKFILWYSVSFVGFESELWNRFKDKIIGKYEGMEVGILDPRYPEVRKYIADAYVKALKDWGLDGFKLDFIDSFRVTNECEIKDGMDCCCIKEGVEKLLSVAITRLREIKSDIVIEFRQGYVGPNMRRYASMFRAVDCPEHYRQNRVGTVDLRLMNGKTPTHSDMLMWNKNDSPETAALQILNSIFSVIQFSMRIENLSDEHKKMAKFWLDFSRENKKLLVQSQIKPYEVQSFYPIIKVEDEKECITAVYEINKVVKVDLSKENKIINASAGDRVIIEAESSAEVEFESYDCMGNKKGSGIMTLNKGITQIYVCKSGLLILRK